MQKLFVPLIVLLVCIYPCLAHSEDAIDNKIVCRAAYYALVADNLNWDDGEIEESQCVIDGNKISFKEYDDVIFTMDGGNITIYSKWIFNSSTFKISDLTSTFGKVFDATQLNWGYPVNIVKAVIKINNKGFDLIKDVKNDLIYYNKNNKQSIICSFDNDGVCSIMYIFDTNKRYDSEKLFSSLSNTFSKKYTQVRFDRTLNNAIQYFDCKNTDITVYKATDNNVYSVCVEYKKK